MREIVPVSPTQPLLQKVRLTSCEWLAFQIQRNISSPLAAAIRPPMKGAELLKAG